MQFIESCISIRNKFSSCESSGVLTSFIFIAVLLSGIYGILHDQITYSISPEYFTKFKYRQFGFEPEWFGGNRATVAVIGFLATWWMGMFIGIALGLLSLIFPDHKSLARELRRAFLFLIVVVILAGFVGAGYGKYILVEESVNWWLPHDLVDKSSFIIVGSIHNSSYFGGVIGLLAGSIYMLVRRKYERIKSYD